MKAGDRVVCVNSEETCQLREGREYVIREVVWTKPHGTHLRWKYVKLEELNHPGLDHVTYHVSHFKKSKIFKLGDAVLVKRTGPGKPYEGFVAHKRLNQTPGTICVYLNWDGDGIYADVDPNSLTLIGVEDLSPTMRESCLKLRKVDPSSVKADA